MGAENTHNALSSRLPGRILLVEDEQINRAILSTYLDTAGYAISEAIDGAIAWDMLMRDHSYDLIVTDRRMPKMDGIELAKRVRNTPKLNNIPLIMQTGAGEQEEILEGIRAGVHYYLIKPYQEEVLLSIVRAAIHDRHQKIIFEKQLSRQNEAMVSLMNGEFHLRTVEEAQNVALMIGGTCARPELAANGFYELFLNAIEHGLLGIGYEGKRQLLSKGKWHEEIDRRLKLPESSEKKVVVRFCRLSDGRIEVIISDNGPGFDWLPFMEIEPSRATQENGRGIAKAALLSFDSIEFIGNGNTVKVRSS